MPALAGTMNEIIKKQEKDANRRIQIDLLIQVISNLKSYNHLRAGSS